jgi:hypothetical protein
MSGACSIHSEMRNAYKISVRKLQGKIPLGRPGDICKDNIQMDHKEIGCKGVNWINLIQNRVQWQDIVNTVMDLQVPQKSEIS